MKLFRCRKTAIVIIILLSALFLYVSSSAEIIDSGTCGDHLTWTLDDQGLLTISGQGEMTDFGDSPVEVPPHPWGLDIKTVQIDDGVTSIGAFAFWGCTRLSAVTIPDSVTCIRHAAFTACTSLESITIPDSITDIGTGAFYQCTGLKSITIPDSVTSLGSAAFDSCSRLTRVSIGNGITNINERTFIFCSCLESVTIPQGVTMIWNGAFCDCTALASVTVPLSLTRVMENVFSGCTAMKDVYYEGTQEDRAGITIRDKNDPFVQAEWHYKHIPNPAPSVTAAGGKYELTADGKSAVFTGPEKKSAKTLVIQDTVKIGGKKYKVTEVAAGACKGMSKLTTLTIGKNVTTIGKQAFYKCKKAKTIKILGTALKTVGKNAFGGGYSKSTVYCAKKKIKAYTKLLQKAGLSKKAVFKELK